MEPMAKDMAAALGTELATQAVALLTRRREVDGDEDCAAHAGMGTSLKSRK